VDGVARRGGLVGVPVGGQRGCQTGCLTGPDGGPIGPDKVPDGLDGWRTEGLFTFKRKNDMFCVRVM
jgi:hypothetical protein